MNRDAKTAMARVSGLKNCNQKSGKRNVLGGRLSPSPPGRQQPPFLSHTACFSLSLLLQMCVSPGCCSCGEGARYNLTALPQFHDRLGEKWVTPHGNKGAKGVCLTPCLICSPAPLMANAGTCLRCCCLKPTKSSCSGRQPFLE